MSSNGKDDTCQNVCYACTATDTKRPGSNSKKSMVLMDVLLFSNCNDFQPTDSTGLATLGACPATTTTPFTRQRLYSKKTQTLNIVRYLFLFYNALKLRDTVPISVSNTLFTIMFSPSMSLSIQNAQALSLMTY